jgi:hypothetical protein
MIQIEITLRAQKYIASWYVPFVVTSEHEMMNFKPISLNVLEFQTHIV